MGHLVELPIKKAPARAVEPGHSAAILFFTGVRYVRMESEASPAPCATRRGREMKRAKPPAAELRV